MSGSLCKSAVQWSVYMVRCGDGSLYTGIATDVSRRMAEHSRGEIKGAKYLRGRGPLRVVFSRAIGSKNLALRVESGIKRLSKERKEALIDQQDMVDELIKHHSQETI